MQSKEPKDRFRRRVQALLSDQQYLDLLSVIPPSEKVSEVVREWIVDKIAEIKKAA